MDLIERQAAIDAIRASTSKYTGFMEMEMYTDDDAVEAINGVPSIDAVQVVRCKDCKHKPSGTGANHDLEFPDYVCPCQCEDYWYSWKPNDDWFCPKGERKEK